MPPAIVGPPPTEAPFPLTPLTVWNSRLASNVHTIFPSAVEYARRPPSIAPENTMPGIVLIAADWTPLQPDPEVVQMGDGAGVSHARCPVIRFTACSPPGLGKLTSVTAK